MHHYMYIQLQAAGVVAFSLPAVKVVAVNVVHDVVRLADSGDVYVYFNQMFLLSHKISI